MRNCPGVATRNKLASRARVICSRSEPSAAYCLSGFGFNLRVSRSHGHERILIFQAAFRNLYGALSPIDWYYFDHGSPCGAILKFYVSSAATQSVLCLWSNGRDSTYHLHPAYLLVKRAQSGATNVKTTCYIRSLGVTVMHSQAHNKTDVVARAIPSGQSIRYGFQEISDAF
jgi:hypothetical protein